MPVIEGSGRLRQKTNAEDTDHACTTPYGFVHVSKLHSARSTPHQRLITINLRSSRESRCFSFKVQHGLLHLIEQCRIITSTRLKLLHSGFRLGVRQLELQ